MSFCLLKEIWKINIKEICPASREHKITAYKHCGATTHMLHCFAITLLILPHRIHIVKTQGPCWLIAQVTSLLTYNNSSLKKSHSRAWPLVFKQRLDKTRQFSSWSFLAHCFRAQAFYFGQFTKAFHCLCHNCCQEMTCLPR